MKKVKIVSFVLINLCFLFLISIPAKAVIPCPVYYACRSFSDCPAEDQHTEYECGLRKVCCTVEDVSKPVGEKPLGRIGEGEGFGPWGNLDLSSIGPAAQAFAKIISNIIGILTLIAGIWFIFQFITGAFSIMSASGDPKKMGEASAKIRSAVIGLVVVVVAYALMSLLGKILGFDFLRPVTLIERLGPK